MRLGFRVGVVVAEKADAAIAFCCLEVYPDWFNVADVKIAIGLWGKAESQFALGYFQMLSVSFRVIALFRQ